MRGVITSSPASMVRDEIAATHGACSVALADAARFESSIVELCSPEGTPLMRSNRGTRPTPAIRRVATRPMACVNAARASASFTRGATPRRLARGAERAARSARSRVSSATSAPIDVSSSSSAAAPSPSDAHSDGGAAWAALGSDLRYGAHFEFRPSRSSSVSSTMVSSRPGSDASTSGVVHAPTRRSADEASST